MTYEPSADSMMPPSPASTRESARWEHTRLRRRMLEGSWDLDLVRRMRQMLGTLRANAWGEPSLAINVYRSIVTELSILYDSPYRVMHDLVGDEALQQFVNRLRFSGMFGLLPRHQRAVIGLREAWLRLDVTPGGRVLVRSVPPDMLLAASTVADPETPVLIQELRLRSIPGKEKPEWTLDHLDVRDPENPTYRVLGASRIDDAMPDYTEAVLGTTEWPERWRRRDGTPFIPGVLYHASRTGDRLFDAFEGRELVEASLDIAVLQQMLIHTFKDASWPQRYLVNLQPSGADVVDDSGSGRRHEIVTDPAAVLILESIGDASESGQPMVGQWQAGGDIAKQEEVLSNMVARVAHDAGVPPSDIQRLGGTARSGAAISLTNEGKRRAQGRYAGIFVDYDERVLSKLAAMLNRVTGSDLPEFGWRVAYPEIPLSADEQRARLDFVRTQMDLGIIGKVEAYMHLHPGVSELEAEGAIPGGEGSKEYRIGDITAATALAQAVAAGEIDEKTARVIGERMIGIPSAEASTLAAATSSIKESTQ